MRYEWLKIRSRGVRYLGILGAAAVAAFALASCGSSGSSSGGSSAGDTGETGSGMKLTDTFGKAAGPVNNIVWALPAGEPDTLDPPNTVYYSSGFVVSQLCDTLLRYEPDLSVKPGLAKVTQPDPKTIQIDLREGVKFWDGTEMTSADVKYSLEHSADPTTIIGFELSSIGSIETVDSHHVTLHLKEPDSLAIKELASWSGTIFEKKQAEEAGKSFGSPEGGIMCSGPYELKKWNPGNDIELTANPNYWDPQFKPHAKNITLKFFGDTNSLASALSSGEVDGAYEVPPQAIPTLENAPSGELHFGPSSLYMVLDAARGDGPIADPDLRAALAKLLDREALADVVFHGAAQPNYMEDTTESWDPAARKTWEAFYKPVEETHKSDGSPEAIEEAKKLVEESEYNGEPLVYAVPAGDATQKVISQLIQQQAKQIGVNITIKQVPPIQYAEIQSDAKARAGIDLITGVTFDIAHDPLEPLTVTYLPEEAYNYWEYDDPQTSALLKKARRTLDPTERAEIEIEVVERTEKENLASAPLRVDEVSFLSHDLSGMTTSFAYFYTPSLALIGAAGS